MLEVTVVGQDGQIQKQLIDNSLVEVIGLKNKFVGQILCES